MEDTKPELPPVTNEISSISFDLIKSQFFRTVHADGMYGGITPHGLISGVIFNERPAVPQYLEHELKDGVLGKELKRKGKAGIVRELEVNLLFDEDTARSMADWLLKRANELRDAKAEAVEKLRKAMPELRNVMEKK